MHLVDVHAHLDHPDVIDDIDAILTRAKANGVVAVIAQGIHHESNQRVLELAKKEGVKAALGLYPSECHNVTLNEGFTRETAYDVDTTLAYIKEHKKDIIAIGEVGIDLKESSDLAPQQENLRKIIRLAKKIRKPLIIHSRKAEEEVLDLLDEEDYRRVVMHCFCGKKRLVERGIRMGLYFSIPTSVVRTQQFQLLATLVPSDQIFTETDTPYMSPMRGVRNEPKYIRDAVVKIADLKRMEPNELANAMYFNYQKLFQ